MTKKGDNKNMKTRRSNTVLSVRPKLVVFVVYKSKRRNTLRGFCAPYDVTYEGKEGENTETVMRKLKESTEFYEDGLKKYDYPKHLVLKELIDEEDALMFQKALQFIALEMQKKLTEDFNRYQTEEENEGKIKAPNLTGYWYGRNSELQSA